MSSVTFLGGEEGFAGSREPSQLLQTQRRSLVGLTRWTFIPKTRETLSFSLWANIKGKYRKGDFQAVHISPMKGEVMSTSCSRKFSIKCVDEVMLLPQNNTDKRECWSSFMAKNCAWYSRQNVWLGSAVRVVRPKASWIAKLTYFSNFYDNGLESKCLRIFIYLTGFGKSVQE